jgi:acyl-CoA thioester hydrolase
MTDPTPLELCRDVVRPEWIDYNGHMNVAYYLLAFDNAGDVFFDHIGLDEAYRRESGRAAFAAECHVTYQREVMAGDPLRLVGQLIGYDEKRMHFFQWMFHAEKGFVAATSEWLSLHIDLSVRRVAPWPETIARRLADIYAVHRHLPRPQEVGRRVGDAR